MKLKQTILIFLLISACASKDTIRKNFIESQEYIEVQSKIKEKYDSYKTTPDHLKIIYSYFDTADTELDNCIQLNTRIESLKKSPSAGKTIPKICIELGKYSFEKAFKKAQEQFFTVEFINMYSQSQSASDFNLNDFLKKISIIHNENCDILAANELKNTIDLHVENKHQSNRMKISAGLMAFSNALKSSSSNQSNSSYQSSTSNSGGCLGDYNCPTGLRCMKPSGQSEGFCAEPVNSFGTIDYKSKYRGYGTSLNGQSCNSTFDCPIGFTCKALPTASAGICSK